MKKATPTLMLAACMATSLATFAEIAHHPTQYVDPMIGSGGHGHVFVGANVPFGFVQIGPSQPVRGWDWCSGYHHSDSIILGISHTHLSGTGIGDLGDILFVPTNNRDVNRTRFSHDREHVEPGYYSVALDDMGVNVEVTATNHVGFHRYTYAPTDTAYVMIDNLFGIGWDRPTEAEMTRVSDYAISGFRRSHGWANDQVVYFYAEFSRPFTSCELSDTLTVCTFAPSATPLEAKVGLSPNSVEAAMRNLEAEARDIDFDTARRAATDNWDSYLSRITIDTDDEQARRIFYTSMYHAFIAPVTYTDVDNADTRYSILSLWDTYRSAHPLYTIVLPEMQQGFADTFMDIYHKDGKLPVWHLHNNETNCMVGNPGVIVLADLVLKGLVADPAAAYDAMKASVMLDERSQKAYREYGYIPYDGDNDYENVARGMEYAIADDAVGRVGKMLGDTSQYFIKRGQSYRNYFDPETKFIRARSKEGYFRPGEFNPFDASSKMVDYCEGNGWQYLWLVPQDPHGLVSLFDSPEEFEHKLDDLFVAEGDLGEGAPPDISGLIGQYAHGNEPNHHIIYLYNYIGKPEKSARLARRIMDEMYDVTPDGLCGNEDVGQMSAWYILSSLGLYQVEPAGGKFVFGSPLFNSATVDVGNGRTFTIRANNNSADNIYIKSAKLNGQPLDRGYILYDEIMNGGTLEFEMTSTPTDFATTPAARP